MMHDELVELTILDPTILTDIKYATPDNFFGSPVYKEPRCMLRYGVAQRLLKVQEELRSQGLGLKVFDAYRPFSVQQQFWAHTPDPDFLAQPIFENGQVVYGSKHNRGAAVDVTLVDSEGNELEMPTGFDEFSERAWRHYTGGSEASRRNRQLLQDIMVKHGFIPLKSEWWHFDAPDWEKYDYLDLPI